MWHKLATAARLSRGALMLCGCLAAGSAHAQDNTGYWEGWYAGGLLGYAWTDVEFMISPARFSDTLTGVVGGAVGGYNIHLSDTVVGGFEADITFGDVMDDMSVARHKVSLVGRLGVLVTPTTFVFGVVGIAGGNYEADVSVTTTATTIVLVDEEIPVAVTTSTTGQAEAEKRLWGVTLGGGFETELNGFATPVKFGLEYRYTNFREWDFVALGQAISIDPDVQEVRARLIFPIN